MHERRCFLLSKQLGGDVLEILFSAAVSLTTGISTFRARIVRVNVYRGRTAKTETGHVYVVSPRLNIPRRCTFPSTRFRVNPCPIPNIYKEFYWNALRLASHLRQSCYPSTPAFTLAQPLLYFHADTFVSPRVLSAFCSRNPPFISVNALLTSF